MPLQKLKMLRAQISPRLNYEGLHLPRGHWPYAMKAPDWQCRHKGGSSPGSNDAPAIGERRGVVQGKRVAVRGDLGGRPILKKKTDQRTKTRWTDSERRI